MRSERACDPPMMSQVKPRVSWESFWGPGQEHEPEEFSGTQGGVLTASSPNHHLVQSWVRSWLSSAQCHNETEARAGKGPIARGQPTFCPHSCLTPTSPSHTLFQPQQTGSAHPPCIRHGQHTTYATSLRGTIPPDRGQRWAQRG